jgi:hypothetical protein
MRFKPTSEVLEPSSEILTFLQRLNVNESKAVIPAGSLEILTPSPAFWKALAPSTVKAAGSSSI